MILVATDVTKPDCSRAVTAGLHEDTPGGRSRFTSGLGGELLAGGFASGGLASGLLGTGHFG